MAHLGSPVVLAALKRLEVEILNTQPGGARAEADEM